MTNVIRKNGKIVKLLNGEVMNECDVKVERIQNELPRFLNIAVGKEDGKWFVQTTDTHEETILSTQLKENIATYNEAYELAKNISYLTGMEIVVWNSVEKELSAMLGEYEELGLDLIYEANDETWSSIRVYGVHNNEGFDEREFKNKHNLLSEELNVVDRNDYSTAFEVIHYFKTDLVDLVLFKNTLDNLLALKNYEPMIKNTYTEAIDEMERTGELGGIKNLIKKKGFDYDNGSNSTYEGGSFAVYEALQGIVNENGYSEGDIYKYADEGRFFNKEYTTVVESVNEERDCILLRHDFEVQENLGYENWENYLDDIKRDIEESKCHMYLDDEHAWDKYDWLIAHPTISSENVSILIEMAEKLYEFKYEVERIDGESFNSHEKELTPIAEELDSLYEAIYALTDKLKNK